MNVEIAVCNVLSCYRETCDEEFRQSSFVHKILPSDFLNKNWSPTQNDLRHLKHWKQSKWNVAAFPTSMTYSDAIMDWKHAKHSFVGPNNLQLDYNVEDEQKLHFKLTALQLKALRSKW